MKRTIAFVDPFINEPVIHCFNELIEEFNLSSSYHMPDKMGLDSLEKQKQRTDAYIIVGSASNITEPLHWHAPLAQLLQEQLLLGKPILGCCFGHQILCHIFGSEINDVSLGGEKITGLRSMSIKKNHYNFTEGQIFSLPVSHRQMVKRLGHDLISLGDGLENDIVAHKFFPMLSTQGHPEASRHFCTHDIQNLNSSDVDLGRTDGKKFIKHFLNHFDLI